LRQLRWTEAASADLFSVADHYRNIDRHLAEVMLERVVEAPRILLTQPAISAPVGARGMRKWVVSRTPFLLTYRILRDGTIEIMRVRHSRSNWPPQ
jgi:toxin ParE1/3/4